jgi:hypothetical protein
MKKEERDAIQLRIGQEFDGELHLSADEAQRLLDHCDTLSRLYSLAEASITRKEALIDRASALHVAAEQALATERTAREKAEAERDEARAAYDVFRKLYAHALNEMQRERDEARQLLARSREEEAAAKADCKQRIERLATERTALADTKGGGA